jgi:hypothetical protein
MFQYDGIRQAILAHPALDHDAHAASIRKDGDQRHILELMCEFRQIKWQPGAHNHRLGSRFAGLAHQVAILADCLHDVYSDQSGTLGLVQRGLDLAVERFQVGLVDQLTAGVARALHQIPVQAPQVDTGNGANTSLGSDRSGQLVGRDADTHAALHHRQETPATDREGWK